LSSIEERFRKAAPAADFVSLRQVEHRRESLDVRRDVVQPVRTAEDSGAMVTVIHQGGLGYAATPDLGEAGIAWACDQALGWARRSADCGVTAFRPPDDPAPRGRYASAVEQPPSSLPLAERIELLREQSQRLGRDERIVDWSAGLYWAEDDALLLTADGGRVEQEIRWLLPTLRATANRAAESQTRTLAGDALARQAGLELLEQIGYREAAGRIADEAIQLLSAPDCPEGRLDLLLAPDQVYLQIHESIGHPLELDRILGDERNYAGTSFVTLDMFGSYQYGSELLDITFDPTRPEQLASYAYDDEGAPAERKYIIKDGILLRPLGSEGSRHRAGSESSRLKAASASIEGVANSRATSWNRAPIDRMANLNLEPGDSTFDELVASVERGVLMETNRSWSIDDSRNKFQFGCELGRYIEDGEIRHVVKNPNYRGVSATFWRSLAGVGDEASFSVLGTPTCGKGEPNQVIAVGHAAPHCLFRGVDVFGGG